VIDIRKIPDDVRFITIFLSSMIALGMLLYFLEYL